MLETGKFVLSQLLGLVVVVLVLALLLPLGYGMLLLLAVSLPPVCGSVIISEAWKSDAPVRALDLAGKLLLVLVLLPLFLVAIAAPIRSVLLFAFSFHVPALIGFQEIHDEFFRFLAPYADDLFALRIDLFWGILGAAIIFMIALLDSIRRNMLVRQIDVMPTAKIRSVAVGLAELKGRAVPVGRGDASTPIIRQWWQTTDDGGSTRTVIEPFYLEDGTGRILVDARGCKVNPENSAFEVELHHALLKKHETLKGMPESRLMPGDTVYVLGNVRVKKAAEGAGQTESVLVMEPTRSSRLSLNFYDLFFLSNLGEDALLERFHRSIKRGWLNVLIAAGLAVWLSVYAWTDMTQIEALDVDAAPSWYRMVTPATTLEREVHVPGQGSAPVVEWLARLERGGLEDAGDVIAELRDHRAAFLAAPILIEQASDIDHPAFGLANYWLGKLGRLPENRRGAEFFDDKYAEANETLVTKLLARADKGRLFVSYRAHFSTGEPFRRHRIVSRTVLIELTEATDQVKYSIELDAHPGWNRADGVEAFFNLLPGVYTLEIHPRTRYSSGVFTTGSRSASPLQLVLADSPY